MIRTINLMLPFLIGATIGIGPASADNFLSAEELKELYSDVRVDTETRRGSSMVFKFKPDGTYSSQVERTRGGPVINEGKWWVEEPDKICRSSPQSNQSCVRHKKTATGYDRYSVDADQKLPGKWRISGG